MIKKETNLSEIIDYLKNNKIQSFEEEIDTFGNYFITAARIAAVILAPNPVTGLTNFCSGIGAASIRISKLFSWLPDKYKYGKNGREKFAIHRYELASVINLKLLDVAISTSFKDVIFPSLLKIIKNIEIEEHDKLEIQRITNEAEEIQLKIIINTYGIISKDCISNISFKIIDPLFPFLEKLYLQSNKTRGKKREIDLQSLHEKYVEKIYTLYNAFLLNLSSEFPEFSLWCDIKEKSNIRKELANIKKQIISNQIKKEELVAIHENFSKSILEVLRKIEKLQENKFVGEEGFPTFNKNYSDLFKKQTELLIDKIDERIKNNFKAHQNSITNEIEKPLSDNDDIDEIKYPKNKQIYIAQSFQAIQYKKKHHKKGFLTSSFNEENGINGEDIGSFLLQKLIDPNTFLKPILILGNPGAGKSMFSKMFAAKLGSTNDFVPFLIRLRDVASSSSHLSEHINKGIASSIKNTQDVNWIDWVKLFKDRIPVIILDGFDELMQSSNIELNGYLNSIKELQEVALNHDICVRIILTSRIAVMQDVSIPEDTTILKLNSFDDKRRNLWVKKWNSFQTKNNYSFSLPKNSKIIELAQEPLLLFMLAIYDFPASELQELAKKETFNQSKLYDSLLYNFGIRQLEKEDSYLNATDENKEKERELFRLRLGMIALLMFLNDSTNKDIQRLNDELRMCRLNDSNIKPLDILTGFFFVHQNKATTETEVERFNYEFLHKSFGEFLAADFLLRIALKQQYRASKDEELFQFCFGYNWLHKHPEIQKFLFEHSPQIFAIKKNEKIPLIDDIQDILKSIFDKEISNFPIARFGQVQTHTKSKIEHIAIYSQNLIFLWAALNKVNTKIPFKVIVNEPNLVKEGSLPEETIVYNAQDRDDIDSNKILWKRMTNLWGLVGNYNAIAKLGEWVKISENGEINLLLRKEKIELKHNFSDSALTSSNDFNFIISLFDCEYKFSKDFQIFSKISLISKNKPELSILVNDVLIYRFSDLYRTYGDEYIEFLFKMNLSRKQIGELTNQLLNNEIILQLNDKIEFASKLIKVIYSSRNLSYASIKILRFLIQSSNVSYISEMFSSQEFEEILERVFREVHNEYREYPSLIIEFLQLLNQLKEIYPLRGIFHSKMMKEIIYRLSKDIRHFMMDNPSLAIEYLRLVRKMKTDIQLKEFFDPNFWSESLEREIIGIHPRHRNNLYLTIEYLQLIDELKEFFPGGKSINPKISKELIYRFGKEFKYIARDNPSLAIEYLRLIRKMKINMPLKEFVEHDFLSEFIDREINEIHPRHRNNPYLTFEYLQLINELKGFFPRNYFFNSKILMELIYRLGKEFKYIIRENPKFGIEYLKLVNFIQLDIPIRELIEPGSLQEVIRISISETIHNFKEYSHYSGELLQIIVELIKFYPELYLDSKLTQELTYEISKNFRRIIKDNLSLAIDLMRLSLNSDFGFDLSVILKQNPDLYELYMRDPLDLMNKFNLFVELFNYENRY